MVINMQYAAVVKSVAGRDKGRWLAVVGEKEGFLLVADGKQRPLERPKQKNPKHIAITKHVLDKDCMSTNKKLRHALMEFGLCYEKEGNGLG